MTDQLKLSIVDQSPVREGGTFADAINETIALAKAAERWGYTRFWLAEHHASTAFAGSSPEILVTRIAAETEKIRVGSGGVMLNHYSPLKVAENFKILETMHPGRIDLGLGRAPGGDHLTAVALAYGNQLGVEYFATRVADTLAFLTDTMPATEALTQVKATPVPDMPPQVWLLGSSDYSGALAAQFGLAFSFAHFINPRDCKAVLDQYRRHFRPSRVLREPKASVGVFAICAETEEEAHRLAASRDLWRLRFERGHFGPYPSPEEALEYDYTEEDKALLARRNVPSAIGTPEQVRDKLLEFADEFEVDELVVLTITYDFKARLKSYELVAREFGLVEPEAA